MGAISFCQSVYAESAKKAFGKLVEEAIYEYGHGSYSGTIKEKDGFKELVIPKGKRMENFISEFQC